MKLLTRGCLGGLLLGLSAGLGSPAWAATKVDPERVAAWELRDSAAKEKIERAAAQKAAALETYQAEKTDCFKKFRVSACQLDAKKRYNAAVIAAEHLSNEGKAEQRQIRREELEDKDARHAIDAAEAARQAPEREADVTARRQQHEAKEAEKLQQKEQQAIEGERRRREREARIAEKQARHEAEVARRMQQAKPAAPAETAR